MEKVNLVCIGCPLGCPLVVEMDGKEKAECCAVSPE